MVTQMAELTYDPTPADNPEFNEAEVEALAIGEAAAAEQEQMLAGKFRDAEELEKAYIELQKKLGASDGETDEEMRVREEDDTAEEEVEDWSPAEELIANASAAFAETGEVSPEMMEQFSSMSSQELVDAYIGMQGNLPAAPSTDLSESDVNSIKNSVFG